MTKQACQKAEESWAHYRSAFDRRSRHFSQFSIFIAIIDRICELGYSEELYAGASLDNLVISIRSNPCDRRQTILVVPQENTVEFRLYLKDGETEASTVAPDQAVSILDRLLPRLAAKPETSSKGTADDDSEKRVERDDFRVDIGRADKGRTFVRVVHVPSGNERHLVGLGRENALKVARRLTEELKTELGKNN